MTLLFWASLAFIVYVYAGYPVLLHVWAKAVIFQKQWKAQRRRTTPVAASGRVVPADDPFVTVIIAARDEARHLPARIDNILASEYPVDRLQIIVADDGSSDDTYEALAPFGARIDVLRLPPRGKSMALNAAVARARHSILVFADARQQFAPDAIRRLVARLADPRIGAVSGELIIEGGDSTVGDSVGAYWRYEKWLRRREAIVGSTLGVTGAIYAMRRELWRALPERTLLDDVLAPMRVVLAGRRVIFEARARAFDQASSDAWVEVRRKVRTLAGNFQLLALEPKLFVPILNPVWFQFLSHKIGRLLVPYALMTLFVANATIAYSGWFYAIAWVGQCVFYGLAIYGALIAQPPAMPLRRRRQVIREAA
jgi:cellulose synthase/poly-beta-1,6-N-acetylglucosamine synthase-like glycosyltransferase